ncbi:MAG: TolC family protein, partial [Alistipes sp.]|nr:TolC family protein [Alistipes sp.]
MKKYLLALCFVAAVPCCALAQLRLTLDAAVEMALSENPTIRVAEMEVARYDYVRRQTWGNLLPQVAVNGQVNHTFIKQNMSKGFSLGGDQYTTISGGLDVTMPLFAPAVYRTLRMNDTQMAAAVEEARASRVDLIAEVRKAFYNILLAKQSLVVLLESQATVQRTVDDTELQYRNGLMSEYDLLTAQVQLSNLKPTIIQTENSIAVAERLLKMYLSIPEEVDIEVVGELDSLRDAVL